MIDQMVAWLGRALFCLVLGFSVAPAADLAIAYSELPGHKAEVLASHGTDRPADEPSGSGGRSCQGPGSCWALPRVLPYVFPLRPPESVVANFSSTMLPEWILPPLDRPPRSAV